VKTAPKSKITVPTFTLLGLLAHPTLKFPDDETWVGFPDRYVPKSVTPLVNPVERPFWLIMFSSAYAGANCSPRVLLSTEVGEMITPACKTDDVASITTHVANSFVVHIVSLSKLQSYGGRDEDCKL